MIKSALIRSLLALGLSLTAVSSSHAWGGVSPPSQALFTSPPFFAEPHSYCPVRIFCRRGFVARCAFNTYADRCACRCVRRHRR